MKNTVDIKDDNLSEINDNELEEVTGGKPTSVSGYLSSSGLPGKDNTGKCKPYVVSTKLQVDDRKLVGQKAVCSDKQNKGKKQECGNCNAYE